MGNQIFIKKISSENIENELINIEFDRSYIETAKNKYCHKIFKIFNLKAVEANILKQVALSSGTDCAVHRNVIINAVELSDGVLCGSVAQLKNIAQKLKLQPFKLKQLAQLLESQLNIIPENIVIGEKEFDWSSKKYLMGIVNVTPDSFSDGGKYFDTDAAVKHALELYEQGADIIDIGSESTRPYSQSVGIEEEQKRILPVIKELKSIKPEIIISVDTRNASTALTAVDCGADIINDTSFGEHDLGMFAAAAKLNIPYVLMHSFSDPSNMQVNPSYTNVVDDIYRLFVQKIEQLQNMGLDRKNIIIDVGIGFGKTVEHNFELLKRMDEFSSLGLPILAGVSRKSFISEAFRFFVRPADGDSGTQNDDKLDETELDFASAVCAALLASKSVNIIRTHEIKRHKLALEFVDLLSPRRF